MKSRATFSCMKSKTQLSISQAMAMAVTVSPSLSTVRQASQLSKYQVCPFAAGSGAAGGYAREEVDADECHGTCHQRAYGGRTGR